MQFKLLAIAASTLALPFAQAYPSTKDMTHSLAYLNVLIEETTRIFSDKNPVTLAKNAPKGLEILIKINVEISHDLTAFEKKKRATVVTQQEDAFCSQVYTFEQTSTNLVHIVDTSNIITLEPSIGSQIEKFKTGAKELSNETAYIAPACKHS